MRILDHLQQAASNLRKKRLRTFLTACGISIGIGALFCMLGFAQGVERHLTDMFNERGLFNYVTVLSPSAPGRGGRHHDPDDEPRSAPRPVERPPGSPPPRVLDEQFLREVSQLPGVDLALPDERFPALIRFQGRQQFDLVQVLPASLLRSDLVDFDAGRPYASDQENAVVVSAGLLRNLGLDDPASALGRNLELITIAPDPNLASQPEPSLSLALSMLSSKSRPYSFPIVGVAKETHGEDFRLLSSRVYLPPGPAAQLPRLPWTNISDLFAGPERAAGYSTVILRLASLRYLSDVKAQMTAWGLITFALVDQFEDIKRNFIYLDLFLLAVGMIAITVSTLGIINTMAMSVLERYREIGIMKAVGATEGDVRAIFFFESGLLGLLGGLAGVSFGWLVSRLINAVARYVMLRQGVAPAAFFDFPLWLWLGAVAFAILISLVAGVYPAGRAARVDPVRALRHD